MTIIFWDMIIMYLKYMLNNKDFCNLLHASKIYNLKNFYRLVGHRIKNCYVEKKLKKYNLYCHVDVVVKWIHNLNQTNEVY